MGWGGLGVERLGSVWHIRRERNGFVQSPNNLTYYLLNCLVLLRYTLVLLRYTLVRPNQSTAFFVSMEVQSSDEGLKEYMDYCKY